MFNAFQADATDEGGYSAKIIIFIQQKTHAQLKWIKICCNRLILSSMGSYRIFVKFIHSVQFGASIRALVQLDLEFRSDRWLEHPLAIIWNVQWSQLVISGTFLNQNKDRWFDLTLFVNLNKILTPLSQTKRQ